MLQHLFPFPANLYTLDESTRSRDSWEFLTTKTQRILKNLCVLCVFVVFLLFLLFLLFFFCLLHLPRTLDIELLKPVLKSAEGETEQFGGARYVPVRLLHGLYDERFLQVFERDAFGRQLEVEVGDLLYLLPDLNREIFCVYIIAFTEQNSTLDGRLQLPNVTGPGVVEHKL